MLRPSCALVRPGVPHALPEPRRSCNDERVEAKQTYYDALEQPVFAILESPEPLVFCSLFSSRGAEVRFGLHARVVGPELHDMAAEFAEFRARARIETRTLDELLGFVPRQSVEG